MATFGATWDIPGLTAVSSLASYQYYLVQLASTAGQVKLATSGTSKIVGVLANDPAAGGEALVQFGGVMKVAAEASVNAGAWVTSSSTGRAKTTTTGGNIILGQAIDASVSAGDIIRVAGIVSVMGD
jgi:hypothetical protein